MARHLLGMDTVSLETIKEVWHRHAALDEHGIEMLLREFQERQPGLVNWLRFWTTDSTTAIDKESLLQLLLVVWEAMTRVANSPLKAVTLVDLGRALQTNRQLVEGWESLSETERASRAQQVIDDFNQPHLLRCCLTILATGAGVTGQQSLERFW